MAGEDQERFEDYLELEHYIEELQAGHVAHPPGELTPTQAGVYRMAALFRSASAEGSQPRPEFAEELRQRLEKELQEPPKKHLLPFLTKRSSEGSQRNSLQSRKRPLVSRRALLTGGAAAAASLVVGAGLGAAAEQLVQTNGQNKRADNYGQNVSPDQATWHLVTTLAALGSGALRFSTDAIVGYVIKNDGDSDNTDASEGPVVAVSAACTHMGCIVQWADADRKFHCPCHGGLFSEFGGVDKNSPINYIRALPRLKTKVEDGKVYVEVPSATNSSISPHSQWGSTRSSSAQSAQE